MPFALQWQVPYAAVKALRDLVLFAFGPALIISAVVGLWRSSRFHQASEVTDSALILCSIVIFVALLPLVSGEPLLRYFLPAAPCLAILGGIGLANERSRYMSAGIVLAAIGWGAAVVQVHVTEHPRVAASKWIWKTLPAYSTIANETDWDEALPFNSPRIASDVYNITNLGITGPDTEEKIERMIDTISRADLIVISSDRQYGPMMQLPRRFPRTSTYYQGLFDGSLCLALAAKFSKPLVIFGIPVDDRWTQESWRVFDRPPVYLFKKAPCFDHERLRQTLSQLPN